jgi:hypothetical protein
VPEMAPTALRTPENDVSVDGSAAGSEPAPAGLARADDEPPQEPRPEIWFKRRIGLRVALHDLWRGRELIATLAERDLRVRYKQALLGFAWAVFTPIMLMLAFTLLFRGSRRCRQTACPTCCLRSSA